MKLLLLILCALCAPAAMPVHAQSYPTKFVRIVVPEFAPGGSGDIVGRTVGAKLTELWGQQVLIDNRPGAAGTLGAGIVARSAPDGYTLLLADDGSLAITPHVQKSLPFDPLKDFVPIIAIAQIEFVLTAHPSVPASNLPELVEVLKRNPGKYSYASAGLGSIHHLSMEWFKQLAKVISPTFPIREAVRYCPTSSLAKCQSRTRGSHRRCRM